MIAEDQIKTKTLFKALQVLDCFTATTPELGVTEISERLGLYKSNVHNIMDTFVKAGYIKKNPENGKYRLTLKVLQLGHVVSSNISFRKTVQPHMQELADATGETIFLAIPGEDAEVVYLDSSSPRNLMTVKSVMGIKAPLYCTGIGKAMLAYLPREVVDAVIGRGLASITDNTITDTGKLLQELETIRLRGYAIDNMEHQFGIKCVGMPIRNRKGDVVAGLSISGPSLRFDEQRIEEHVRRLGAVIAVLEIE
ncbi:IclR family transcriptional regulator [Paenibacillus mesophilus]|uniref:IclR family transcriptional regulator n=1 Tax=Paenibacillus mesophilus TaxID=2582849 RepID=UPI00110D7196|nr:IclR family transcriptional regulator [Paenibacillus mesophilus]TMV49424.1 IclR family transcriptional regulator [Paenibacillus mesophilus]